MATAINLLHRHGLIVNSDTYTRRLSEPVAKREIKNISANRSKVKISQLDLRVVQIARARARILILNLLASKSSHFVPPRSESFTHIAHVYIIIVRADMQNPRSENPDSKTGRPGV